MKGELHIWEDGKAILTIIEGNLEPDDAYRIVEGMKKANKDFALLTFNFPVEVIHEKGDVDFMGVGVPVDTAEPTVEETV